MNTNPPAKIYVSRLYQVPRRKDRVAIIALIARDLRSRCQINLITINRDASLPPASDTCFRAFLQEGERVNYANIDSRQFH